MGANHWKLVVTPLGESAEVRQAVVEAENWLSGLRLARRALGEEGGVPSGASCVMSASGEVTILDANQRRRYVLTRVAADAVSAQLPPSPVAPQAPVEVPQEAVATPSAPAPDATAPMTPTNPTPKRSVTVAYSPDDMAQIRKAVAAGPARPVEQPPSSPVPAPAAPAMSPAPVATFPSASAAAAAVAPSVPAAPVPTAPAARTGARSATVAYMESPLSGEQLIPLGVRDQEPDASSPLIYRERSYFTPRTLDPTTLEALLHAELRSLQESLRGRPRGQFVNLAVFDHYFQGRPQRSPVATLQWKDWRGAPEFALAGVQRLPSWHPSAGPVRTSFVPGPPAAPAQPSSQPPVVVTGSAVPVAPQPRAPEPKPAAPAAAVFPLDPFAPAAVRPAVAPAPATANHNASPFGPVRTSPAFEPVQGESHDPTGEQDRRLATAFETTQDLYFLNSPVEGLDFAVKLLSELIPCEAISGGIYDINADVFRFVALLGPGADERRAEAVPSTAGLMGAAVRGHRESFVVNAVESDPRFDPGADGRVGLTVSNIAYFPLQKTDHLLGMLQILNRKGERGFSEADLAVASYVAAQLAEFLLSKRGASGRRR